MHIKSLLLPFSLLAFIAPSHAAIDPDQIAVADDYPAATRAYDATAPLIPITHAMLQNAKTYCTRRDADPFVVEALLNQRAKREQLTEALEKVCDKLSPQWRILQLLIARGANVDGADIEATCKRGDESPLRLAAAQGATDIVEWLLAYAGANIEARDNEGFTALHFAAYCGQLATTRCLVHHGASIDAVDDNGVTPLMWAAKAGHTDIIKYFVTEAGTTRESLDAALHYAADCNRINCAEWLIAEGGADIETRNACGLTALHIAARNGYSHMVKMLIKHGAKVLALTNDGRTPADFALKNSHETIATFLLG